MWWKRKHEKPRLNHLFGYPEQWPLYPRLPLRRAGGFGLLLEEDNNLILIEGLVATEDDFRRLSRRLVTVHDVIREGWIVD